MTSSGASQAEIAQKQARTASNLSSGRYCERSEAIQIRRRMRSPSEIASSACGLLDAPSTSR
jgi:hypothetical protein